MDSEEANRKLAESRLNMGKDPGGAYADLNQKYENQQQERQRQKSGQTDCFAGDTKVLTNQGWTQIIDIRVGQTVTSYNNSGRLIEREVMRRKVHSSPSKIWKLEFSDGTEGIRVTLGHSFLTERGWLKVSNLKKGELIPFVAKNGQISLHSVEGVVESEGYEKTFNLVTAGECNFIVRGAVVHNFTYLRTLRSLIVNVAYLLRLISAKAYKPFNISIS